MNIEELMKIDFRKTKPEVNFLEIIRKQDNEVIASNILAYFFDPSNRHGLENTFYQALAQTLGIPESNRVEDVQTEEITDNDNRIDLVIETENSVIGIENKLFAPLNNDLDDYSNHLSEKAKTIGKKSYLVVLSLNEIPKNLRKKPCDKYITYAELIKNLKNLLGEKFSSMNVESAFVLKHFLKNLENLKGEDMDLLKPEEYKFLVENETNIKNAVQDLHKNILKTFEKKLSKKMSKLSFDQEKSLLTKWENNLAVKEWYGKSYPFLVSLWIKENSGEVVIELDQKLKPEEKEDSYTYKGIELDKDGSRYYADFEDLKESIWNYEKFIEEAVNKASQLMISFNKKVSK